MKYKLCMFIIHVCTLYAHTCTVYIPSMDPLSLSLSLSLSPSLADHFGGKLHIGFVTIREKIAQLEVIVGHSLCTVMHVLPVMV